MRVSTICTECAPFAHAASLVATGESLLAFWYQGAREGGFDVSIQSSRFDGTAWTKPEQVADQMSIAAELGRFVKSLGNPVAYAAPDGKITLFFVAVAMRGWATAYIAFKQSDDGGRTWSPARPLVTSPVWNLSTMIKTAPLKLPNGRIGLPAYWSLGTTYPVMIELTEAMQVADIKRMAPLTAGIDLIRSTVEGEPCFCISSEPMTFTGRAASSGEPAMKEPVTTTSETSTSSCAKAWPAERVRPVSTPLACGWELTRSASRWASSLTTTVAATLPVSRSVGRCSMSSVNAWP